MNQLDIDWDAVPAWANWAAQDADGSVWVFERRPVANAIREAWDEISIDGRVDKMPATAPTSAIWTATLTRRADADPRTVDWDKAPAWAQWVVMEVDGVTWFRDRPPHRAASARPAQPQTVAIHQDNDGAGMLRAQIGHLLEDMSPEHLDALYAHVRKQLDAAKFAELNRQLDRPFGEVPREWQLKAFEAFLDGHRICYWHTLRSAWDDAASPSWTTTTRYRIEPKQS